MLGSTRELSNQMNSFNIVNEVEDASGMNIYIYISEKVFTN